MKNTGKNLWWIILSLLLAVTSSPALCLEHSGVIEQIANDFKSLDGVVVMRSGSEILVDLDEAKGLVVGDLLTVIKPGEAVVHPDTGMVLGHLSGVKAVLQVTKVGSGYSYTQALGDVEGIERGDTVHRYDKVSTVLWDYTQDSGDGEVFYSEIKDAISHLNWQGYQLSQRERPQSPAMSQEGDTQLYFILQAGALNVRGADFELIHHYTLPVADAKRSTSPVNIAHTAQVGSQRPALAPMTASVSEEPIYEQGLTGSVTHLTLGDFDGDHVEELAVAFDNFLEISQKEDGQYLKQDMFELGAGAKILHLDAIDLDQDGCDEVYVTAVRSGQLVSRVICVDNGVLTMKRFSSPWYFRKVDMPGEGDVLLAQCMGEEERDFDGMVFRVTFSEGQLQQGETVELPWGLNLYGFVPFISEQGDTLYAVLGLDDTLQVMNSNGQTLWESLEQFGGSVSYFDTHAGGRDDQMRRVYIKTRVEKNAAGEVLLIANKGTQTSMWRKKFVQGTVVALRWDGSAMREIWRGQTQGGALVDFCVIPSGDGQSEQVLGALGVMTGDFWGKNDAFSKLISFKIE